MNEMTFAVTLVKPGTGVPVFEVGAYRYTAGWLPVAGDIITITKAPDAVTDGPHERLAYVTRVDPAAETPIRVTEPTGVSQVSADDYIVAPADDYIVEAQPRN
jgi:hypothetical protein